MSKTATIPWAELSENHVNYIRAAIHNKMNVAEGAIRSGKTNNWKLRDILEGERWKN